MIDRIYFLLRISTTFKETMEDDDAPGHFSIAYRKLLLSILLVGWRNWKQISILYKFPHSKYICFHSLEWKVTLLYPLHVPCFWLSSSYRPPGAEKAVLLVRPPWATLHHTPLLVQVDAGHCPDRGCQDAILDTLLTVSSHTSSLLEAADTLKDKFTMIEL